MHCTALSPVHQNLVLEVRHLYVPCVPYCCACATFAFSPVICNGSLSLLLAAFGPCVVIGPGWGRLGLGLSQTKRLWWHQTARHFGDGFLGAAIVS